VNIFDHEACHFQQGNKPPRKCVVGSEILIADDATMTKNQLHKLKDLIMPKGNACDIDNILNARHHVAGRPPTQPIFAISCPIKLLRAKSDMLC
jgi:hypothetical protein